MEHFFALIISVFIFRLHYWKKQRTTDMQDFNCCLLTSISSRKMTGFCKVIPVNLW